MRKSIKSIISVIIILLFIIFPPNPLYSKKDKKTKHEDTLSSQKIDSTQKKVDISERKKQLQSIKEEIKEKREKLTEVKKKEQKVSKELEEIEKKLETTRKKLRNVSLRLVQATMQKEAITYQLMKEEERFRKKQAAFASRLRQVYEHGPLEAWEILFGAVSFFDFLNRVEFLYILLQYDIQLVQEIKETKEKIEQRKLQLTRKCEEIEEIKKEISIQEKEEKKQVEIKEDILDSIKKERIAYERAIRELEETSREIEAWIKRMEAQRIKKSPYTWTHKWIKPVNGNITSGFGWRMHPIFKITKFHTGIDIEAPEGTPIVAVADGEVIFSDWWGGYGKVVIIDHGSGVATLYGHCSNLLVSVGQHVKAGKVIATVGSTGISTGPHLHFEIRKNGVPINPLQ